MFMKQAKHKLAGMLLLVFVLMSVPMYLSAQQLQVTGKVTDEANGNALEGVSVVVKKTAAGTATDAQGTFKITAAKGEKIVFSFSGYQEQVVSVSGNLIEVKLFQTVKQLDDVVVTALGVKKEKKIKVIAILLNFNLIQ